MHPQWLWNVNTKTPDFLQDIVSAPTRQLAGLLSNKQLLKLLQCNRSIMQSLSCLALQRHTWKYVDFHTLRQSVRNTCVSKLVVPWLYPEQSPIMLDAAAAVRSLVLHRFHIWRLDVSRLSIGMPFLRELTITCNVHLRNGPFPDSLRVCQLISGFRNCDSPLKLNELFGPNTELRRLDFGPFMNSRYVRGGVPDHVDVTYIPNSFFPHPHNFL